MLTGKLGKIRSFLVRYSATNREEEVLITGHSRFASTKP